MTLWYLLLMRAWTRALRRLSLAVSAVLCVAVTQPAVATASCKEPALALLWSYPANGDTNVPTNALLWALSSTWRVPSVTLDGAPLTVPGEGVGSVSLGALAPQHDYVLRLEYMSAWQVDAGSSSFEIRFRTGDGPATKLPAVPVAGVQRASGYDQSPCPDVVRAQDCFDTGQDTLFTFDVSDPRAIGWLIRNEVWPARCGKPSYYGYHAPPQPCFDVRAIGTGGVLGDATQHCLEVPDAGASARSPGTNDDGPEAARPARADSDAGAPGREGATALSSPSTTASPNAANEASCSVARGTNASRALGWLLFLLATTLLVRLRRSQTRKAASR